MIEHVSVPVSSVRKSKAFYTKALKPLGYEPWMAYADAVGFVEGGHARLWIGKQETVVPMHVAFLARSRKAVHDFHAAALKAGGKDNGKPGYRDYSSDYYARSSTTRTATTSKPSGTTRPGKRSDGSASGRTSC